MACSSDMMVIEWLTRGALESWDFLRCHVQERGDLGAALRPRAERD